MEIAQEPSLCSTGVVFHESLHNGRAPETSENPGDDHQNVFGRIIAQVQFTQ